MSAAATAEAAGWDPSLLEELPSPVIDAAACGDGITVSADGRSATSSALAYEPGSRVVLASGRARGRLRVEFCLGGAGDQVAFGYALADARACDGCDSADVGTQWTDENCCTWRGDGVPHAPFCYIPAGCPAALLMDAGAGTLGYEVRGRFVGTLFRGLQGVAVVPAFFVNEDASLTVTRVLSGAGACARRRLRARGCGRRRLPLSRQCAAECLVRAWPCVSDWGGVGGPRRRGNCARGAAARSPPIVRALVAMRAVPRSSGAPRRRSRGARPGAGCSSCVARLRFGWSSASCSASWLCERWPSASCSASWLCERAAGGRGVGRGPSLPASCVRYE